MSRLTLDELDELAFHLPHVEAWTKAVRREIQTAIENGHEFANAKLVDSLGNRAWKPDADPLKVLRKFSRLDVIAPRVPLSPTLAEFVHRPVTARNKLVFSHPEVTERN
jgi:hypothetical protein